MATKRGGGRRAEAGTQRNWLQLWGSSTGREAAAAGRQACGGAGGNVRRVYQDGERNRWGGVRPSTTTPPHPPVAVQPHPPVAVQPRRWWHPRARTPPPRARQRRYLPPGVRPTHAGAPLLPSPPLDTPPFAAASAPSATLDPHHRKAPAVAAVAPPTAASAAGRLARERRARLHPPPPPPAGPRRRAAGWEDAAEPVTRDARPLIASAPPLQSSSNSWVADVWICDEIGQLPPPRGPLEPPVAASATARGDGGGRNHQTVHQIDRADRGFEIGLRRQVSSPKEF